MPVIQVPACVSPNQLFSSCSETASAFCGIQISASSCSYNCPCPIKLSFPSNTSNLRAEASPWEHGRKAGFQRRDWCGAQLSAASHPCHARSLHPEEQDYPTVCGSLLCSIHQLTTTLQTVQTTLVGWVSDLLQTRALKPFPPEAIAPALKFSAFKTDHHFAVLITTHQLLPYCTRAAPSDWSSTRANILHSPRRDQTSWKSLSWGNTGITRSSLLSPFIPTVPRRKLLLLTAKPQGELHQQ